jgi:hypothetical protein
MAPRFDIRSAPIPPLRAEPRHADPTAALPIAATAGGLVRSTLVAAGVAAAVLTVFYLPAEYGVDPTGLGSVLGLTEMGEIKQQLYAEAAADDALAVQGGSAAVVGSDDISARLAAIETQVAAIAAVVGADMLLAPQGGDVAATAPAVPETPAAPPVTDPEPAADSAPVTAPEQAADPAPAPTPEADVAATVTEAVTEAVADTAAAGPAWRDEVSYTLAPGEGIEVKLVMVEGAVAQFAWTANGAVVNYDTHGDGSGQRVSYEQGRGVPEQSGELVAAFTGNHGWFWRNRTEGPVTVTLRAAGDYSELKLP